LQKGFFREKKGAQFFEEEELFSPKKNPGGFFLEKAFLGKSFFPFVKKSPKLSKVKNFGEASPLKREYFSQRSPIVKKAEKAFRG